MRRRSLVLVVSGGALALAGALGVALLGRPAAAEEIRLPAELGGLSLASASRGVSAEAEIERLHGRALPISSAAVGLYGPAAEATLWVVGTANEEEAAALVDAMRAAIVAADGPFTQLESREIAGVTVFPLLGMGQEHVYFRSGRLVVWLAADPSVAETARLAVVEAYR